MSEILKLILRDLGKFQRVRRLADKDGQSKEIWDKSNKLF